MVPSDYYPPFHYSADHPSKERVIMFKENPVVQRQYIFMLQSVYQRYEYIKNIIRYLKVNRAE